MGDKQGSAYHVYGMRIGERLHAGSVKLSSAPKLGRKSCFFNILRCGHLPSDGSNYLCHLTNPDIVINRERAFFDTNKNNVEIQTALQAINTTDLPILGYTLAARTSMTMAQVQSVVTVENGGTLNLGNSIGTLTVNGNLSYVTGSIYEA